MRTRASRPLFLLLVVLETKKERAGRPRSQERHSWTSQAFGYTLYIRTEQRLMKVKLAKWGNSLGLRVPKAAAEAAGLKAGTEVDVVVEGRELRIRPSLPFKYYRLQDLIAEMDRLAPENRPEVIDWGPDVGAEIIDDDYSRGLIPAPSGRPRVGRSKTDTGAQAGRRPAGRRTHGP